MERKYGFKESRKAREQRLREERRVMWKEQVSKQDRGKLERERDALARAAFLTPQQKERQRLVGRMLEEMLRQEEAERAAMTKAGCDTKTADTLKQNHSAAEVEQDAYAELVGGAMDSTEGDANKVTMLVPHSLLRQQRAKTANKEAQKVGCDALAEEKRLLEAMRDTVDFDTLMHDL